MRKILLGLLGLAMIATPAVSSAKISVQELWGMSAAAITALNPSDVDINPSAPAASDCLSLGKSLTYRTRDAQVSGEVSDLQDFLQSQGYLNAEPTGYFGIMTQKAVRSFQSAYGISQTGTVGPLTRAKINGVSCGTIASTPIPLPSPVLPSPVPNPSPISLVPITVPGCPVGAVYNYLTGQLCNVIPLPMPIIGSTTGYYSVHTDQSSYTVDSPLTVTWSSPALAVAQNATVDLLKSDGTYVGSLGQSTTGKFTWIISPKVQAGSYKIRITNNGAGGIQDGFSNIFTIQQTSACYLFTRNLTVGSQGDDVAMLQYFLQQKGYLGTIGEDKGYFGAVTQAALKAFQAANNISPADGYFGPITRAFVNGQCVTTTSLTVVSPNGGENLTYDTTYTITWKTPNPEHAFRIILTDENGFGRGTIIEALKGNSYTWGVGMVTIDGDTGKTIKTVTPGRYKISIQDLYNGLIDNSDAAFNIGLQSTPSITILSPNGGENWILGNKYSVKYQQLGLGGAQGKLHLFRQGQDNTACLVKYITLSSNTYDSFDADLSQGCVNANEFGSITPSNYKAQIYLGNNLGQDLSDNYFTISSSTSTQPSLKITNPLQGHLWTVGDIQTFRWTTTGLSSNMLGYIDLVGNNGQTYRINNITNYGEYTWNPVGTINNITIPPGIYSVKIIINGYGDIVGPLTIAGKATAIGDINGDGKLDASDVKIIMDTYNYTSANLSFNPKADLNNDKIINTADVSLEFSYIGLPTPGSYNADTNGDGIVNLYDFGIVRNALNSKLGDANYNAAADYNKDNAVNAIDQAILVYNMGAKTTPAVPLSLVVSQDPNLENVIQPYLLLNQYTGAQSVSLMTFNVKADPNDATITSVSVFVSAQGNMPTTLYLYDGSTMIASQAVTVPAGAVAVSQPINNISVPIAKGQTKTLTIKADFKPGLEVPVNTSIGSVTYQTGGVTFTTSPSVIGRNQYLYKAIANTSFISASINKIYTGTVTTGTSVTFNMRVRPVGSNLIRPVPSDFSIVFGTTKGTPATVADVSVQGVSNQTLSEGTDYTVIVTGTIPNTTGGAFYLDSAKWNFTNGTSYTQIEGLRSVASNSF
jgi:peptidoglycan hydrolase-like protein with peptidoglycan-binding domain/uncharacterized protein (DUF2141 family)